MCDWPLFNRTTIDSSWSRKIGVLAFDRITKEEIAPIRIMENFQGGVWMSWVYKQKSIRFRIVAVKGNGPTLSVVAFDENTNDKK